MSVIFKNNEYRVTQETLEFYHLENGIVVRREDCLIVSFW